MLENRPHSSSRRPSPIIALLLVPPVIAELLFGSVRLSTIFFLLPQIATWGCGALLIREWTRRWKKPWQSLLLLAIALAVAEEWLIQQTSIAPLTGIGQHDFGRFWGVNWPYFLWAAGYESVWVVLLPVSLTELLYQDRREVCWLRTHGMIIATIVFVWGCCAAWYGWTQRARVAVFHMAPYSPPALDILIGVSAVVALCAAARLLPDRPRAGGPSARGPLSPWTPGLAVSVMGTGWSAFAALGWGAGAYPHAPVAPVLAAAVFWAAFTFECMRRWTRRADWSDAHRFAVVFGGVLGCSLGGFLVFAAGGATRADWIGKLVFDAAALLLLAGAWRGMHRPERGPGL